MIKITIDSKNLEKGLNNLIRYLEKTPFVRAEAEAMNLAYDAITDMITTIDANRVRDKKAQKASPEYTSIADALGEPEQILNDPGKQLIIGIGKIATLKQKAPYWEMINDGAIYTTKTTHVVPFEDLGKGQYPEKSGNFRTFQAGSQHVILGIDYIGHSMRNLEKELKLKMKEWGEKFLGEMGK
jgi:hypothetical protein